MPYQTPVNAQAHRSLLALLVWGGVAAGCAPGEDAARRMWLQSTLVDDNRDLLARDPDAVGGKFAKMGTDAYTFLRGTAGQFVRDAQEPGPGYAATAYGSADTSSVWLVGDPHPENLGTFRAGSGEVVFELNDFDAARYGPYTWDLRRLATGFVIFARTTGAPDVTLDERLARAVAAGYRAGLGDEDRGAPVSLARGAGALADDALVRALADGRLHEELERWTRLDEGGRRFVLAGAGEDQATLRGLVAATSDEDHAARALFEAYRASAAVDPGPVRDVARRRGAGVSSYALLRFYVLTEGPTASPDDDLVFDLKEARDPMRVQGLVQVPSRRFVDNATRIVDAQRAMQSPDADRAAGAVGDASASFVVHAVSGYQQGIDQDRVAEGRDDATWTDEDLVYLAQTAGRLLARAHVQGGLLHEGNEGVDAAAALQDAAGEGGGLDDETVTFALGYADQVEDDHGRFLSLLEERGPLLGYVPRPRENL